MTVTPEISGFTPASGAAGSMATITGTNLSGAVDVAFNDEGHHRLQHRHEIVADVPAGATSGQITVTTPAGTAMSHSSFTVT